MPKWRIDISDHWGLFTALAGATLMLSVIVFAEVLVGKVEQSRLVLSNSLAYVAIAFGLSAFWAWRVHRRKKRRRM